MDSMKYEKLLNYKVKGDYPHPSTKQHKYLIRRKASSYRIEGNDLFYVRPKGSLTSTKIKVIKGAEEAERVFVDFYDSPTGTHRGQIKTLDAISRRFYWP
ncbi:hypothetical protein CHARACLAT_014441 [Characodon lateralis]|uniref:Integrase zinc-binding domain-containing protein n=1 Tax=Characodon lateralis TaxID=208331 RepID=A0ABU7DB06_9TELE|nr:hypothetical protein [Characodon lateralis]